MAAHYGKSRKWFPFQPHYADLTFGVCLVFWLGQKAFLAYKPALKPDQLEKAGDGLAKLVGIAQVLASQKSGTGKVVQIITQTLEPEPPPAPFIPKEPLPRGPAKPKKQSKWGGPSQAGVWMDKIMDYVRTKGQAQRGEIAEVLGIYPQTLYRHLQKLVKEGKLEKTGDRFDTVYRLKKED